MARFPKKTAYVACNGGERCQSKYDGQYRTSLPLVNTPYERKKKGE